MRLAPCRRPSALVVRRASSTVSSTPAVTRSNPVARKRANIGAVQLDGSTKRWYKKTAVVPSGDGGWEVLLDDRSINTPKSNSLRIPTEPLAYAIAHEWEAQQTRLNPKDYMPLVLPFGNMSSPIQTALAITAVDTTGKGRDSTIGDMISDISDPPHTTLHAKKDKIYTNIHRLFNYHFNVVLTVTDKPLLVAEQKPYTIKRVEEILKSLDDWELTGTYDIASYLRSTVLGMGVQTGFINADQALEAGRLEEEDQIIRSGELPDIHEAARAEARVRVGAAAAFLSLLRIK